MLLLAVGRGWSRPPGGGDLEQAAGVEFVRCVWELGPFNGWAQATGLSQHGRPPLGGVIVLVCAALGRKREYCQRRRKMHVH